MKYNAALANDVCVFDEKFGFDSVDDVISWAKGRGGAYVIHINRAESVSAGVSISYDDDNSVFMWLGPWEWETIPNDKIVSFVKQYI